MNEQQGTHIIVSFVALLFDNNVHFTSIVVVRRRIIIQRIVVERIVIQRLVFWLIDYDLLVWCYEDLQYNV